MTKKQKEKGGLIMKKMKVCIKFKEGLLGSCPADPEIYTRFIGSKAENTSKMMEEVAALGNEVESEEKVDPSITVFSKGTVKEFRKLYPDLEWLKSLDEDKEIPFIWDYQIKGFFKNAAKAFYQVGGESKISGFKTKVDNLVFVMERKIPLHLPDNQGIIYCQRPLRASTAKGERIALACSEEVPAETTAEFTIEVLQDALMKRVIEWMNYGALNGLGQWHNSGKGRFTWTDISDTDPTIAAMEEEKKKSKGRGRKKKEDKEEAEA